MSFNVSSSNCFDEESSFTIFLMDSSQRYSPISKSDFHSNDNCLSPRVLFQNDEMKNQNNWRKKEENNQQFSYQNSNIMTKNELINQFFSQIYLSQQKDISRIRELQMLNSKSAILKSNDSSLIVQQQNKLSNSMMKSQKYFFKNKIAEQRSFNQKSQIPQAKSMIQQMDCLQYINKQLVQLNLNVRKMTKLVDEFTKSTESHHQTEQNISFQQKFSQNNKQKIIFSKIIEAKSTKSQQFRNQDEDCNYVINQFQKIEQKELRYSVNTSVASSRILMRRKIMPSTKKQSLSA